MPNIVGRLIVGCVLACCLTSNTDAQFLPPDYGTDLWLEITNISNNRVNGLIHNSSALTPYAIF